jgi:two-component system response regulator GlrR
MTPKLRRFDGADEETQLQPHPSVPPRPPTRRCPIVSWSDATGDHTAALDRRTVVGSAEGVDLLVADPTVSRMHAELELRDDGVWVRDLGSRNGTFVSGVMVSVARVPANGRVQLGSTVLALREDGTSAVPLELWPEERFGPLIGRSASMRELFTRLARVSPMDSTVLIHGETGTGKELVARAIHEASPRATKPLVVVDCASLPETLLEAELFGHARGAFTGAVRPRAGAFEAADGGTVLLDEIGELPLAMQPKLLRAIESRAVRRLGETAYRPVDVRIVSATHCDLREMVNSGAFREDLYFRLAVLPVELPPLRGRTEDIPLLIDYFLPNNAPSPIGPDLMRELAMRPWVGNVRELRNFVERAIALGAQEALAATGSGHAAQKEIFPPVRLDEPFKQIRERWIDHLEREYVQGLLALHDRNIAAVADAAGLDRTYVYRLVRKHDL